jgi:hypothetical protein
MSAVVENGNSPTLCWRLHFIEAFCAKIRNGLDLADFNTQRLIIELLDVRSKIAFENNEKVVYLKNV